MIVKRLVLAASAAVMIHGALLAANIPWSKPRLLSPQSKEVTISLVQIAKPDPKPAVKPPPPKPKPREVPKQRPQPKPDPPPPVEKPEPSPPPIPEPAPKALENQPVITDNPPAEYDASQAADERDDQLEPSPSTEDTGATVQVSVPLYELNPSPHYPRVAQRRRYQGTVVLDVLVDKSGNAAQVKVAQSSGFAVLDRSAVKDVEKWRFKPARKGFKTVEMWVQVPVRYQLK